MPCSRPRFGKQRPYAHPAASDIYLQFATQFPFPHTHNPWISAKNEVLATGYSLAARPALDGSSRSFAALLTLTTAHAGQDALLGAQLKVIASPSACLRDLSVSTGGIARKVLTPFFSTHFFVRYSPLSFQGCNVLYRLAIHIQTNLKRVDKPGPSVVSINAKLVPGTSAPASADADEVCGGRRTLLDDCITAAISGTVFTGTYLLIRHYVFPKMSADFSNRMTSLVHAAAMLPISAAVLDFKEPWADFGTRTTDAQVGFPPSSANPFL